MMTYRLYYCDRDNRVTHFTTLESADDHGAIEQARRLPHRFNKEVWGGARRLQVIPGMSDAEAANPRGMIVDQASKFASSGV